MNRRPVDNIAYPILSRSFWTNSVIQGPRWVKKENYPFTSIPVYIRENTVLLLGPENVDVPDYDYAKVGLEVRSYQVADDQEVVVQVPSGDGPKWAGKITVKGGQACGDGVKVGVVSEMKVTDEL